MQIGKKHGDKGVVFTINKDRNCCFIETCIGFKDRMSNKQVQAVYDNTVAPRLENGDYYAATLNGMLEMMKQLE